MQEFADYLAPLQSLSAYLSCWALAYLGAAVLGTIADEDQVTVQVRLRESARFVSDFPLFFKPTEVVS